MVEGGWYADRFGFHQHPEDWSTELNIKRRAHERCRRAWVEKRDDSGVVFCTDPLGISDPLGLDEAEADDAS